jgi:hypothetical protein
MAGHNLDRALPIPRVNQAEWNALSDADKLSHICGRSLDRIADIMDIDAAAERNLAVMQIQAHIFTALCRIRAKAYDKALDRDAQQETLARIDAALRARARLASEEEAAGARAPEGEPAAD